MAFSSLIDDTRRMNAKMIAMGQSIDIQKMPRPKQGSQMAQKQAMFTPSGSDVEKMLYPKNFKAQTYQMESAPQEKIQIANEQQMVDEIREQTREPAKIIGDDDLIEQPRRQAQLDKTENAPSLPMWARCKHYKAQGDRAFCKEYLGWCAKEKCSRPKL
ncbi:MAG: hypothetical protein WCW44_00550 [archaeon]|jgi:hypothetical protein